MKLVLLLAFVGLAASASLRSREFKSNTPRELRYQYDAQVATGIEEVSNAFSTMRMRFEVVMRTDGAIDSETGAERWSLVFRTVNIRQRNNATDALPKTLLPMEQFRNIEKPELWFQMERTLKKPFGVQIRPRDLTIVKVLFDEEDPFWSVNIKKGFLSLLQVNFIPKDASRDTMEKGQWTKETDEMTIAATCKAFYSANKIEYHESDTPVWRVDKAIDFNNCLNPIDGTRSLPGIWNGLRHVRMLPGDKQRKDIVEVNNMAQYLVDMGGDQMTPTVRKASAKTVHVVVPYKQSTQGSEKIFTVQKLRLLNSGAAQDATPIDVSGLKEQPEGIRLVYPEEAKNVDREALKSKVIELFGQLFKSNSISTEIDAKVYESILRILRYHLKKEEDLTAIAEQLKTAYGEKELKAFILDICPQIGSHGAVKFLMQVVKMLVKTTSPREFVTRANLNAYHISIIFTKLSMMEKVQLKMLKTILEVVKDEAFRSKLMNTERMPILSTAWLSVGALVNVYYGKQGGVEPYIHPIKDNAELVRKYLTAPWEVRQAQAADSEEFRREFVQLVKEGLERSDFARNLALKVTKNSGLFELYEKLAPIIRKRDTTMVTERVQAVYATQNMLRLNTLVRVTAQDARSVSQEQKYIREDSEHTRHFKRINSQIQADLISCFRNVREDPEVRIACYRVLMQCENIKQTVLNMLIQSILSEPTQQVHTYCAQHMSQIAKNSLPRYSRVSQTVRSALSMLKRRQPLDLVYSRVYHGQMWDELHQMGFTVETDMIVSDKAFTPRWTHIRIENQGLGLNMPLLEIGLRTQGLQGLLEKVFGPRGLVSQAGGVMKLLKRAARSLDASTSDSSELLQILPRILKEVPNMDLTISLMGYDIIYVKNTRQVVDSVKSMNAQALKRSLVSIGKFIRPFDGLFTISNNFEIPTPAGTILDFNCLLNIDFQPKFELKPDYSDDNSKVDVKLFVPLIAKAFRRIGSNMHVLNHYHQLMTIVNVNKDVTYGFIAQLDKTNPKNIVVSFKKFVPTTKVPIVKFQNLAFSTISESHFANGRLSFTTLENVIKHRKVAKETIVNYTPVVSKFVEPFGFKLQFEGKYLSARHLYQAPCSLFMGPSEYKISVVPTLTETSEDNVISSKLVFFYPTEESKVPQIKLEVNNALMTSEDSETIKQKLVEATFTPRDSSSQRMTFDFNLRWFLNLPSSFRSTGYQLKTRGEIELPEDLKMKPRSLPLQPEEWYTDRQLKLTLNINDDEREVATIKITQSTNPELKKLLVDSDLSENDLKKMFPLLVACLNESRRSVSEEPLSANPLYTPSCVRQFKKFNKLSQTKIEISPKVDWFLSRKDSPLLDKIVQKIKDYLRPFKIDSFVPQTTENKIIIVSRPSPVDFRVQHLNFTSPNRKYIWRSIQLPSELFFWAGVDPLMTAAKDFAKGGASKCSLLHSHVRTFDNVIYSIPKELFSRISENRCPMLLARDCSDKKEFQVLASIQSGKKCITVHLNTDTSRPFSIELCKPVDRDEQKATVKVNGAELEHSAEPREETEIMRRAINTEKGPVTVVISKYQFADTIMYKIKSVQHKVMILAGGSKLRKVEIRVSPFYHNKVCGLCGDYNAEKFQEFKAPNYHQVVASPKKMVEQYVLPISDSCRMNQETDELFNPETSLYLPNKIWYKSYDLPTRRQSCQIKDNKKVKTFKHAELEMVSPALKQIIRDTECAVKLAVAKIDDQRVRVYLQASQSKVTIRVGSFKQILTTTSPALNELSSDALPAGLSANIDAKEHLVKFKISKGDNRVTVKVTSDKRIIIKASQISQSEDAICELSQQSQIEAESSQAYETIKKFTNADESSVCRDQLKKKTNQCEVQAGKVLPFYRARDYHRRQVRFLNDELKSRLADSKTPVVLSVDQIGEDSSVAHSVQLVYSRESGKLVRQVLLKKNQQTLLKITVPERSSHRVTYTKNGAQQTIVGSSSEPVDFDGDFQLTADNQRVKASHKRNLYELDVDVSGEEPKVKIVRPYAHDSYKTVGLCQVNKLPEVMNYRSNPQAVLSSVMETCLNSQDASAPVLSEQEIAKINEMVGNFNEFVMM